MIDNDHIAKVKGFNLPISTKFTVEICNFIRGKDLKKAKNLLKNVTEQKIPIPFKIALRDLGHKKGIGPGRYPVKASEHILDLLKTVDSNASYKGLNSDSLVICYASATKGVARMKPGRQRGRKYKFTNVEIVVKEKSGDVEVEKKVKKDSNVKIKMEKKK